MKVNHYQQLTRLERAKIYGLHEAGMQADGIAEKLGRHRSTIYRELARNRCWFHGDKPVYLPNVADNKALKRRQRGLRLMEKPMLKALIVSYLKQGWSPEQIAGRLKLEHGTTVISHETIYAYIYDKRARDERLYLYLSKRRRYRHPRVSRKHRRGPIPNRRDIAERPIEINHRKTFGHWEGDLILFKKTKTNLITMRERKSRFMIGILNPSKASENTSRAIIKHFNSKKPGLITTLTLDNGGEFAQHENISTELKIDIFFCRPYASYQKGSVENGNRQLRRDLPRDTVIDAYSQQSINDIVNAVNNRPLKCLGFKTPSEVLMEHYGNALEPVVAVGD